MSKVEIVNTTVVCRNFPEELHSEIHREHLLDTVDKIFEGDTQLVIVEGLEGIGKTTLMAQYAKRHPDHSLSLFIKSSSRLAYAPEYLRTILSEQLHWVLNKEALTSEILDESFLATQLGILQRRAIKSRAIYYFIIDGLHELPKEDLRIQDIVLKDMLPLGLSGFRFLISGDSKQLSNNLRRVPSKTFPLSAFSLDETERYLHDLNLERDDLEDIYKMCGGVPGHLAIVKRMLQSGINLQTIMNEDPDNLPDFIAIEWQKLESDDDDLIKLLAVIAYGRKEYTLDELSQILTWESSIIGLKLKGIDFIIVEAQSKEVKYVSEAHRRYAINKLRNYKDYASNLLIDFLLKDAESDTALSYLPTYYEQAGRLNDLLEYLTPDHFTKVLERSQSLGPVCRRADLGLTTSRKLNREENLIRFSIQRSVLTEFEGAEVWRSEVEARISLQDYESALALAHTTILKEDRLRLLATIARVKSEQGIPLDQELLEQITSLYDQIDKKALGGRAIGIASDIMYIDPDLAVRIVEETTGNSKNESDIDWAFAILAIAANEADVKQSRVSKIAEETRSKIKDPKAKEFSNAASLLLGESSAVEAIARIEKLEAKNRLFFLRQWAVSNYDRDDSADVIDYALDVLIKDTLYTPKTRDLRELATALPSVSDTSKAKKLVGRFDSQKGSIEEFGTSEDYVRLQLLLAETEYKYDSEAAKNRMIEVYWYINGLTDLSVKADCMAWVVSSLPRIDPEGTLEALEGMHTVVQEELKFYVDQLLLSTAEHAEIAEGPISALAKSKPQLALDIALSLNIIERRDASVLTFIKNYSQLSIDNIDFQFLQQAIETIVDPDLKDEAYTAILRRLALSTKKPDEMSVKNTLPLINSLSTIQAASQRCITYSFAYAFLTKQGINELTGLSSELLQRLKISWESIDTGWEKVDVGFKIAKLLSKVAPEIAKEYMELSEKFREEVNIDAEAPAMAFLACLDLSIRAFSGLLPKNLDTSDDLARITSLIDSVPSNGERSKIWGIFALRSYNNKRFDLCQHIVVNHIKPLLQNIPDGDQAYKRDVLVEGAPALFCGHRTTALEMISTLPQPHRDEAYGKIIYFIFSKHPTFDPYERWAGDGYLLSFEEAIDICDILRLIEEDGAIYLNIIFLAESLLSRRNKDRFTKQQKIEISERLKEIINTKLPDRKNIKHEGYKIAAQAQVARIQQSPPKDWDDLLQGARNIPNTADKAFVLTTLATAIPVRETVKRNQAIEEALLSIATIPSDLDRIDRYAMFAEDIAEIDSKASKRALKEAMEFSMKVDDPLSIHSRQRKIIDIAHRIDPNYAATLASLADNDPARTSTFESVKGRVKLLDTKKKMLDKSPAEFVGNAPKSEYAEAAWMNLGSLNAGRAETLHSDFMRHYIEAGSEFPLHDSFPIFLWAVENAVRRYENTPQAAAFLLPIFEATLLGAELAKRIATRTSAQLRRVKKYASQSSESTSLVVRAGEREAAIQFLRDWFSKDVKDYLKICDPFFGIHDLEVLQLLRSVNPTCSVSILTSKKHQSSIAQPFDESFRAHWRIRISDQDPPDTEIVIVGTETSGDMPIHDRWWLTNGGGIRIGTSYNSLGITKASEVSLLSPSEAKMREDEVDKYLHREKKEHNKVKLHYTLFTL